MFAISCTAPTPPPPPVEVIGKVYICNEGGFMYGNASLSVYDEPSDKVFNQVFYDVNGFPLGDVLQSMVIRDNKGFLVINNSGVIYVIDIKTNKYINKIDKLTSPRYIEFVNDNKAYVSDLYSHSIAIINPSTYEVTGSIFIGIKGGPGKVCGTEQMVRYKDFVYVCSWSYNNKIYKIDTRTDKLVDSLTVTKQPNSLTIDKLGKIWSLSDGGFTGSPYGQETAALTKIDAETFSIEQVFEFPTIESSPSELQTNGTKDKLFFINGSWANESVMNSGVYSMNITDTKLPETPLIPENKMLFYGLGVHPVTSEIYVSDAIDYVQKGWVFRYDKNGSLISQFKVDIIPSAFCFRY